MRVFIEFSGLPLLTDSLSPLLRSVYDWNFWNYWNDLNLFLWLPAAAQSAIELHHRIELSSPHTSQCQLLVEELLISDKNL